MEPLLENDIQATEKADFNRSRISTLSYDTDYHSVSTQSSEPYLRKSTKTDKNGWFHKKTQAINASLFKGSLKHKDYNYICYKYLILALGILTVIFTVESVNHLLVYFTPIYVHLVSLGMRGWDIFNLFKLFKAMQRKDAKAIEEAIVLIKWFIGIYCLLSISLFTFSSKVMIYLTGYLATAAYVDGDAAIFKSRVFSMFITEIFLYVLVLCGAYGVRTVLKRYEEAREEEEDNLDRDF